MSKQRSRIQGGEFGPSAARAVEREVARETAQEQKIRPARTGDELRASTLGLYGALPTFEKRFDVRIHERIVMLITELEQRIAQYLQQEKNGPQHAVKESAYTEALLHGTPEHISAAQKPLLNELNPILRELLLEIQSQSTLKSAPYATAEGLIQAMQSGEVERHKDGVPHRERVDSFIGLLHRITKFDLSHTEQQTRVLIVNPYEKVFPKDQQQMRDVTKDAIAAIEAAVAEELGAGRALAERKEEGEVLTPDEEGALHRYENYHVLISWLKTESRPLQEKMNERDLHLYKDHINLLHGEPEEVTQRINGIEQLKHQDAGLVMKLFGVVPGNDIIHRTARKSALAGSIFHLGVYNARQRLHRDDLQGSFGVDTLRRHIEGLTLLSIQQPELFYLNDDQMKEIGRTVMQGKESTEMTSAETSVAGRAMVALHVGVGFLLPAYAMRQTIEKMTRNEDREFILERLRKCGPHEFIERLKSLPHFMQEDKELQLVVEQRLGNNLQEIRMNLVANRVGLYLHVDADPDSHAYSRRIWVDIGDKPYYYPFRSIPELIHAIKGVQKKRKKFTPSQIATTRWRQSEDHWSSRRWKDFDQWYEDTGYVPTPSSRRDSFKENEHFLAGEYFDSSQLTPLLWETASDEAVLTEEFLEDIPTFIKLDFLRILDAHPEISRDEWWEWYRTREKERADDYESVLDMQLGKTLVKAKQRVKKRTLSAIPKTEEIVDKSLSQFTSKEMVVSQSQIFTLYATHQFESTDNTLQTPEERFAHSMKVDWPSNLSRMLEYGILEKGAIYGNDAATTKKALEVLHPQALRLAIEQEIKEIAKKLDIQPRIYISRQFDYYFKVIKNKLEFMQLFCPESPEYKLLLAEPDRWIIGEEVSRNAAGQEIMVAKRIEMRFIDQQWQFPITHTIILPIEEGSSEFGTYLIVNSKGLRKEYGVEDVEDIPLEEWTPVEQTTEV